MVFATAFSVYTRQRVSTQALAFTHVAVIDATGSPPQSGMTVVIAGDRIIALGKTGKVKIPQNKNTVIFWRRNEKII
jgi:hypothetical protein